MNKSQTLLKVKRQMSYLQNIQVFELSEINKSKSYYEQTKYLLQGNNFYEFGMTGFHNTIKLALMVTMNYWQPPVATPPLPCNWLFVLLILK